MGLTIQEIYGNSNLVQQEVLANMETYAPWTHSWCNGLFCRSKHDDPKGMQNNNYGMIKSFFADKQNISAISAAKDIMGVLPPTSLTGDNRGNDWLESGVYSFYSLAKWLKVFSEIPSSKSECTQVKSILEAIESEKKGVLQNRLIVAGDDQLNDAQIEALNTIKSKWSSWYSSFNCDQKIKDAEQAKLLKDEQENAAKSAALLDKYTDTPLSEGNNNILYYVMGGLVFATVAFIVIKNRT